MYKNRSDEGYNNISGRRIKRIRQALALKPSQRQFAERLQARGLDLDKNAIQRIECGKRFVTDIELKAIAEALGASYSELLDG